MVERIGSAVLELFTDDSRMVKGIRSAEQRTAAFGQRIDALGKRMSVALTAPFVALAALSARAFDKQIQASSRLSTAVTLSGESAGDQLPVFKKFASALQSITTTGDETTLANIQVGKSMGLSSRSAARAAKNAIAMEAAFGISSSSAIRMTAALEQGDATMLNRYIPTLKTIKDDTERAAAAQDILSRAFGIATTAATEGLGPYHQMMNDLGDLAEQFGKLVVQSMAPFIARLRGIIRGLQNLSPAAQDAAFNIAAIGAAAGPALLTFGLLVKGAGLAMVGMRALGRGINLVVRGIMVAFTVLGAFFTSPVLAVVGAAAAMIAAWTLFTETMIQLNKAVYEGVWFWLVKQFNNNIKRPFLRLLDAMFSALPQEIREFLGIEPIEIPVRIERDALDVVAEGFGKAREAAAAEADAISEEFDGIVDSVKEMAPEGVSELLFGDFDTAGEDIDAVSKKLAELLDQLPDEAIQVPKIKGRSPGGGAGGAADDADITDPMPPPAETANRARQSVQALRSVRNETGRLEKAMDRLAFSASFAMEDMSKDLLRGEFSWRRFGSAVIGIVGDVARSLLLGPGNSIGSLLAGGLTSVFSGIGGFFSGGVSAVGPTGASFASELAGGLRPLAAGGTAFGGRAHLVGEVGPELFVPNATGQVVPNHILSGLGGRGGGNSYFFDARGADQAAVDRLERVVREELGPGRIEQRSISAVVDARRRNPALLQGV